MSGPAEPKGGSDSGSGVATRLADADLIVVLTREDGDLLALSELEPVFLDLLRGVPGLLGVQRMRGGVSPRWRGEPRYQLLASSGITPGELNRSVAYALEGRVIRRRMENGEPDRGAARPLRAGTGFVPSPSPY